MASDPKSSPSDLPQPSRREFLVTKLAVGFALAVSPAGAQTITTDTKGLTAGEVQIPVAGGKIPGYRAMPSRGSNMPVVIVVQEIFGVHEHIKDLCRRFAKAGYCAVAPELFARQGDVSKLQDVETIRTTIVSKVPDAQVISDIDATIDWAVRDSRGNPKRVALTGFCWGGRIAWMYAALGTKVKIAAAWYGRLEGDKTALTPKHPLDYAGALQIPVLGFYAGKDSAIPLASVNKMKFALEIINSSSEIEIFPEADHGFNADYRPSYNKVAAERAWMAMMDWFKKAGV